MTLTFDPLTLKVCGRSDVVVSLIEIEQYPAPNSNTAGAVLKTRGPICTKLCGNIARSSLHAKFKNG